MKGARRPLVTRSLLTTRLSLYVAIAPRARSLMRTSSGRAPSRCATASPAAPRPVKVPISARSPGSGRYRSECPAIASTPSPYPGVRRGTPRGRLELRPVLGALVTRPRGNAPCRRRRRFGSAADQPSSKLARRLKRSSVLGAAAGREVAHAVDQRCRRACRHPRERLVRNVRVRPRRRHLLEGLDACAHLRSSSASMTCRMCANIWPSSSSM